MLNKIKAYVEKYHMIEAGDTIVAGVSGGADSVCLLFVLLEIQKDIPFDMAVAHIDHGIRKEAKEEADYVAGLCSDWGIPFYLYEADIRALADRKGISEEEAGRNYRYRSFDETLRKLGKENGKVAVAHNRNDRGETMLFHLFRGSGLTGMSSIKPVRDHIIRPLLCVERKEIEEFLHNRHILYCTDGTNQEDIYARNRIRHHIIPYAEEICHNAVLHMADAADRIWEAEEYIRRQAGKAAAGCVTCSPERVEIDLHGLIGEDALIQKRVLMDCLEYLVPGRKDITAAHVAGLRYIASCVGNRTIDLPYDLQGIKEYNTIILKKKKSPLSIGVWELEILSNNIFPYEKSKIIPQKTYTKWFDYDKITKSAVFRTRQKGDYLTINKEGNHKSLKEYMINEKISREDRDNMYVLADGSHIMWIPGYRISEYYKIDEQTNTVMEICVKIWSTEHSKKEGDNTND